jgi:hypothetical protein
MHLPLVARDEVVAAERPATPAPEPPPETDMRIGPPELLPPVLSRALSALAARRDVAVDRVSDAMLLSDAISANAPDGFSDGHVSLSIADRSDGVELRVGPMMNGAAERLRASLDLPEVGGSLATLADEVRVEQDDEGEFLVVGIAALAS